MIRFNNSHIDVTTSFFSCSWIFFIGILIQCFFTILPLCIIYKFILKSKKGSETTIANIDYIILIFLFCIGFFIRTFQAGMQFPAGIEQDEYLWIHEGILSMAGTYNPFRLGIFGIPVLQNSIPAIIVSEFGFDAYTLRLWSSFLGSLLPVLSYFLVQKLFKYLNPQSTEIISTRHDSQRIAALAVAIFFAFTPYVVFYGRIVSGSRMLYNVLGCILLFIYLIERKNSTFLQTILFGLLIGLSVAYTSYDYFAIRSFLLYCVAISFCSVFFIRINFKKSFFFIFSLIGFSLGILPAYFTTYDFVTGISTRMNEQSVVSEMINLNFDLIFRQLKQTALMFHQHVPLGRDAWFSETRLTPLPLISCIFFSIGLVLCTARPTKFSFFLLMALCVSLFPTIFSSNPPDSHRAIVSLIPVGLIIGYGFTVLPVKSYKYFNLRYICLFLMLLNSFFSTTKWFFGEDIFAARFADNLYKLSRDIQNTLPEPYKKNLGQNYSFYETSIFSTRDPFVGYYAMIPGIEYFQVGLSELPDVTLKKGCNIFYLEASQVNLLPNIIRKYPESKISTFYSIDFEKLTLVYVFN